MYFSKCLYLNNILHLNGSVAFYLLLAIPKEMSPDSKT